MKTLIASHFQYDITKMKLAMISEDEYHHNICENSAMKHNVCDIDTTDDGNGIECKPVRLKTTTQAQTTVKFNVVE